MNIYNQLYLLLCLVTLIAYLPLLTLRSSWVKFIIAYLVLLLVTFLASVYLANIVKLKSNLFIFHISTPLEFTILSFFFRSLIASKEVKKGILLSIPFFLAISIIFPVFIQSPGSSNPTIIIIESIILIFLSLFYLREIFLLQQVNDIRRFSPFWIVVGILFYYTGSIIIEGMLNYMISHSMELAARIFRIGYTFKYLLFIVLTIGAFCQFPFAISLKKKN